MARGNPAKGLENVQDRVSQPGGPHSNLHGARMLRIANNYVVVRREIERVFATYSASPAQCLRCGGSANPHACLRPR